MSFRSRLARLPPPFDPGLFTRVADDVARSAETLPGVVALWTYGANRGVPWLSDVDLLFVIEPGAVPIDRLSMRRIADPAEVAKVVRTEPVVVDAHCFHRLEYAFAAGTGVCFSPVTGGGEPPAQLDAAETKAVMAAIVLDTVPKNLLALALLALDPAIDPAALLRLLAHLRASFQGVLPCFSDDLDPPVRKRMEELCAGFVELKRRAHELTRGQLADGIELRLGQALELYGPAMETIDGWCREQGLAGELAGPAAYLAAPNAVYVAGDRSRDRSPIRIRGLEELTTVVDGRIAVVVPVPASFFLLSGRYREEYPDRGFSRFLRARVAGGWSAGGSAPGEATPFLETIRRRARLCHDHFEVLARGGGGFGLDPDMTGTLWSYRQGRLAQLWDARTTALATGAILDALGEE